MDRIDSIMAVGKVSGIAWVNIAKYGGVSKANIASLGGGASPPKTSGPAWSSTLFQFEDQTRNTSTSTTSFWNPSNTHSAWVNGGNAVNGTYWGKTSNKTVTGWNCDDDGTGSGRTGPTGGVVIPGGTHSTSADSDMYLYSEVSSQGRNYCFVTRMPGFNFNLQMGDTSRNLDLQFWVHAYGSNMGDLYVYIDSATTSNHSSATELAAYESFSGFTSNSSVWQQKTISLNSYRNITNQNHYIYFVTQNATGFRGDLAIDGIQFVES